MKLVFIDEAGNTGCDFLSVEQPYFALSGVCCTPEEAHALLEQCFPRLQSEAKHASLVKQEKNYAGLLEVQQTCIRNFHAITILYDKKYACVKSFVQDCVAPLYSPRMKPGSPEFRETEYFLYTMCSHNEQGPLLMDVLNEYQRILKDPEEPLSRLSPAAERLASVVDMSTFRAIANQDERILQEIALLRSSYVVPSRNGFKTKNRYKPSLYVALFALMVSRFSNQITEPTRFVCDTTTRTAETDGQLEDWKCGGIYSMEMLSEFYEKPLFNLSYFEGLFDADSKTNEGIQLADIVAGGAVFMAKECNKSSSFETTNPYATEICRLYDISKNLLLFPEPEDYASWLKSKGLTQ